MRRRYRQWHLREPYFRNYKLFPHEVVEIYYMVTVADLPRGDIARHFGISASHVSNIGAARFWTDLLIRKSR